MDKNTLIERIKGQLKELIAKKFAQIQAGDLTITSPDEDLLIGSKVYSVDSTGANTPLVDGEYTCDDGSTITVVNGEVSALESKTDEAKEDETGQPEEIDADKEMAEAKASDIVEAPEVPAENQAEVPSDTVSKLADRVAALEESIKHLTKINADMESMKKEFAKIAEQPSVEKIKNTPVEFKSVEDKKAGNIPDVSEIIKRARALNN